MKPSIRAAVVLAPTAAVLLTVPSPAAAPSAGPRGDPPIDHVIVIVEQNHTFDSYFGTYPGARGFDEIENLPQAPGDPAARMEPFLHQEELAERFHPRPGVEPLSNGRRAAIDAYNAGAMDGFALAQHRRGFPGALALMHHDGSTAQPLWDLAREFVLFDNYYSSAMGGSLPNMLHLIAGDDRGAVHGTKSELKRLARTRLPTIFDRLEASGISWRYYVGGLERLDPERILDGSYLKPSVRTPPQLYWAPILSIHRFWEEPALVARVVPQHRFFTDAANGRLPAVSFVLPSPTDHPLIPPRQGLGRLASLVNAVAKGRQWECTALFVVWDDWGGFYDHVRPPPGNGFRVPALLISPWARRGHVSSVQHDHTSVLNFIVERFGLDPLSPRQEAAPSFDEAFHDQATPRAPRAAGFRPESLPPIPDRMQTDLTLTLYVVLLVLVAVGLMVLRRGD